MQTCEIFSDSPAATQVIGKRIGSVLKPGSVIGLTGELGCGKTLLTRGICHGLNVPLRQVNSPTFILVNEYTGRLPVFHLDVYRLDTEADAVELGITDYLERTREGVMVVEWAEKIPDVLPAGRLGITFQRLSARKRQLVLASAGKLYDDVFKELEI